MSHYKYIMKVIVMRIEHQVIKYNIEYKKKGFRSEKEYLDAKLEDDNEEQSDNIEDFDDIDIDNDDEKEDSKEENVEEDEEMEVDE